MTFAKYHVATKLKKILKLLSMWLTEIPRTNKYSTIKFIFWFLFWINLWIPSCVSLEREIPEWISNNALRFYPHFRSEYVFKCKSIWIRDMFSICHRLTFIILHSKNLTNEIYCHAQRTWVFCFVLCNVLRVLKRTIWYGTVWKS